MGQIVENFWSLEMDITLKKVKLKFVNTFCRIHINFFEFFFGGVWGLE